jgi:uncharacterized protein (DUF58 family)
LTLAATAALWLHRLGEPVGLAIVGAERPVWLPAQTSRAHLQQVFRALAGARAGGPAELADALRRYGARIRPRSKVIVVSDGMEEPAAWVTALAAYGRRKVDLTWMQVYDRRELRLDDRVPSLLYSPEGGVDVAVDPPAERAAFIEVADAFLDEVRAGVIRMGHHYVPVPVDMPLDRPVWLLARGRSAPNVKVAP